VGVLAVQFVPNSLELISIERNRRKGFIPDYSRSEKAGNRREKKSGAKGWEISIAAKDFLQQRRHSKNLKT
jgi:hypothetical protein